MVGSKSSSRVLPGLGLPPPPGDVGELHPGHEGDEGPPVQRVEVDQAGSLRTESGSGGGGGGGGRLGRGGVLQE